jgi:hypothetical protein
MKDEQAYHAKELTQLEQELAAVVRQFGRAAEANDRAAEGVEVDAVCRRIQWLLYHHLSLRLGDSDDDWFWLDLVPPEECHVEQVGRLELRASGRCWCSLPEGRRQWTEPFAASISHSSAALGLSAYVLRLGNLTTLLDLPSVRRLIEGGEKLSPPTPARDHLWAFMFRMGDRV